MSLNLSSITFYSKGLCEEFDYSIEFNSNGTFIIKYTDSHTVQPTYGGKFHTHEDQIFDQISVFDDELNNHKIKNYTHILNIELVENYQIHKVFGLNVPSKYTLKINKPLYPFRQHMDNPLDTEFHAFDF